MDDTIVAADRHSLSPYEHICTTIAPFRLLRARLDSTAIGVNLWETLRLARDHSHLFVDRSSKFADKICGQLNRSDWRKQLAALDVRFKLKCFLIDSRVNFARHPFYVVQVRRCLPFTHTETTQTTTISHSPSSAVRRANGETKQLSAACGMRPCTVSRHWFNALLSEQKTNKQQHNVCVTKRTNHRNSVRHLTCTTSANCVMNRVRVAMQWNENIYEQ